MWTDGLPTLLLLHSIVLQAQFPSMPSSAHFTQTVCPSATGSRNDQIELFDSDGKQLGAINETCSPVSGPCKIEGSSDITIGPYTVKHPGAIFGPCVYKDGKMEITTSDKFNTLTQQLFATCKVGPFACAGDPEKPTIGTLNEVIISEFPSDFKPTSVVLREYTGDGCEPDQNPGDLISNTVGCKLITNKGIVSVVVEPKPDMPSTCNLTLYADLDCISTSKAVLGPITPGSDLSACIGPIRNSTGGVFAPQAAILKC